MGSGILRTTEQCHYPIQRHTNRFAWWRATSTLGRARRNLLIALVVLASAAWVFTVYESLNMGTPIGDALRGSMSADEMEGMAMDGMEGMAMGGMSAAGWSVQRRARVRGRVDRDDGSDDASCGRTDDTDLCGGPSSTRSCGRCSNLDLHCRLSVRLVGGRSGRLWTRPGSGPTRRVSSAQ